MDAPTPIGLTEQMAAPADPAASGNRPFPGSSIPGSSIPGSSIPGGQMAGAPMAEQPIAGPPAAWWRSRTMWRTLPYSLTVRFAALGIVLIVLPILVYSVFQTAEQEKRAILEATIRDRGTVIAEAVRPLLTGSSPPPLASLPQVLDRFQVGDVRLKLLFRPRDSSDPAGFLYIAAAPSVSSADLDLERERLIDLGILGRLSRSCDTDIPLAERLTRRDGGIDLLLAIAPMMAANGCWALVISSDSASVGGVVSSEPYWRSGEVTLAMMIYAGLAGLITLLFLSLWLPLRRFAVAARRLHRGKRRERFAALVRTPELQGLAHSFDRMVDGLTVASDSLRQSAEQNAHAFKTPIAIVRQALEPLHRRIQTEDRRGQAALETITHALNRLEGLVQSARHLDEATADLLDPVIYPISLTEIARRLVEDYRELLGGAAAAPIPHQPVPQLILMSTGNAVVGGRADLLETIFENLIDNALSFVPADGRITITVRQDRGQARVSIADTGPGVSEDVLPFIFERNVSDRTRARRSRDQARSPLGAMPGFGLGLWLVRRHVESLGGTVAARNLYRAGGMPGDAKAIMGFEVTITLPLLKEETGGQRSPWQAGRRIGPQDQR